MARPRNLAKLLQGLVQTEVQQAMGRFMASLAPVKVRRRRRSRRVALKVEAVPAGRRGRPRKKA